MSRMELLLPASQIAARYKYPVISTGCGDSRVLDRVWQPPLWSARFREGPAATQSRRGGLCMPRREPDDLRSLGDRLDAARGKRAPKGGPPPTSLGIAFRFGTELGAAVFVGAGLGWLLDKLLHTSPIFLVVLFCLGAAAGIRNVMRAAAELNAQAASSQAPAVNDDDEEN